MKKIILLSQFIAWLFFASAQISTLPYTESFSTAFTTGNNVVFVPNFTGNTVATTDRIFRDTDVFASAPAAMSIVPTGTFNGEVLISLNLTNFSNVVMSLKAKSMLNGTGDRSAILNVATSIDGGANFTANTLLGTFPNADQADFTDVSFLLPSSANGQSNVVVRLTVTRSGGSGTTAKLVIDDVNFAENPVIVVTQNLNKFFRILPSASNEQSFEVSGGNLSEDITITAPAGFQISTVSGSGYGSSVSLTPVSGTVATTQIFAILSESNTGNYSGNITASSSGATTQNFAVSGVVSIPSTPSPFFLNDGDFLLAGFDSLTTAGGFFTNTAFWTRNSVDANNSVPFADDWKCKYDLNARSRIRGLNDDGIMFLNTGNSQREGDCDGSNPGVGADIENGFAGALVVALNTTDRQNIEVNWKAVTELRNTRIYEFRLQYRIGDGGGNPNAGWLDFATPVVYSAQNDGEFMNMSNTLPSACNNQPLVFLRWSYDFVTDGGGQRSRLVLDDIEITSAPIGTSALILNPSSLNAFNQTLGTPSDEQIINIEGLLLTDNISVSVSVSGDFEISLTTGAGFTDDFTINETSGAVAPTNVYVRLNAATTGSKSGTLTFSSSGNQGALNETVSLSGLVTEPFVAPELYINEFMASNNSTIADEFGEFDDWVEIFNASSFDVDLAGYYISDNLNNLTKYQIPINSSVATIPAGGFLLIWADNQSSQGDLHTNFSLSASGEDLVLVAPDGTTIIDSYTFGPQTANISEGREQDGSTNWIFFNIPTPNASNSAPFLSANPTAISFNQQLGTPSSEQSFVVQGASLSADAQLTVSSDFEISLTSGTGFTQTLNIPLTGSNIPATTVFVRLNAGTLGAKTGVATITSGSLSTQVSLSGVVVEELIEPELYINEFMASNSNTIADEFDEYDDWIEIYNASDFEVNLAGYYISDDLNNLTKYRIPVSSTVATIPAKGFLLIWADNQSSQGDLHTNFALSSSGEDVVLVAPDGVTIVDSYTYGPQNTDISMGREVDGFDEWVFFTRPTPGASNNDTGTSITSLINNELKVYPVPVDGNGMLFFNKEIDFVMVDIAGKVVTKGNNQSYITLNNLSSGVYFLQSMSGERVKIVVR